MRSRATIGILVARRIFQVRRTVRLDTQQLRAKTMQQLEQLFDTASAIARGQIRWQRVGGKKQSITLKQRQMWARVAAYIAQVMNTISNGIDERQIDKDLDMLEKLVNEASEEAKAKERSDSEGEKASSVC